MPPMEVNGVRLLVEESGSGEPLVLVHGSWGDREVWALIEDELARSFRVISFDRRGHTGSEDGAEPGTRRDDEDDLAALIEALGIAPAHVAGNSFGGAVALGLAARRPELFRTLAAHEPPLVSLAADDPVAAHMGEAGRAVVELVEGGDPEAGARYFVENVALGPGAWELMPPDKRASMAANAQTFVHEQLDPHWADIDLDALGNLRIPVLLTQGEQSPPLFPTIVSRLAGAIHGAEVQTMSGAGHIPHLTHPADYVEALRRFAFAPPG